jgi:hypothetical protein
MRHFSLIVFLVLLVFAAGSCFAGVWLGIDVINEEAGIYGISMSNPNSDYPVDINDLSMLEIRLPILWGGTPGTWKAWGPTYDLDGTDMAWTVETGLWNESSQYSFIRWTAPNGSSIPLPLDLKYHYFWFQVPSYLKVNGDSIAEIFGTDSTGKTDSNWTKGVPTYVPEPSSILVLTGGLIGIGGIAWRKKR